ncbi:MAG TPA: folylpolyglutamate synthase/dihydrofolate synthase family protein, partial [Afifellaceae bacterium]|nr:folylpolyglutamate synthase/dihydrofolate synthase family protein [Afifellaceae bacterium]
MPDIDAMLDGLYALHPRRIDLSLDRILRLLDRLGRPQDRLPPVVHVAGTNGKGSVVAFLRAMLEADGQAVHVYTSPHLVRFNERIRLGRPDGGRLVDDDTLAAAIEEVQAINAGETITYFEITTAIALHLFAERPADYCLLEVGLGGRYDATNVIDRPLATAITPVSLDHAEFLGNELTGVAAEKAGILKRGVPGIVAPQDEHALAMIQVEAKAAGASLFKHGEDWMAFAERGRLVYQDGDGLLDLPLPRLTGQHQVVNAGTAVAILRGAGIALPPKAIEAGLVAADWPARLQRLKEGPLVAFAPEGAEVWLDGGHNPSAGAALASSMAAFEDRVARPLMLVVGMLTTKDPTGFLAPFEGLARHLVAVPVPGSEAGFAPSELAAIAMDAGLPARPAAGVRAAIREIAA